VLQAGTAEEKLAEVRRLQNDLRPGGGDFRAGRKRFAEICAGCHRLFGEGDAVGPDLTSANRFDLDGLLVSIVDPSAHVRKEFLSLQVRTRDGRILVGLPAGDAPGAITLINANRERVRIGRAEVASLSEWPVSLMPEDLLRKLKPKELRDLFAYLTLREPPEGGPGPSAGEEAPLPFDYRNRLVPLASPRPLLADHPQYVAPIDEMARFEAPPLIDEPGGEIALRAWRFSYNARGIVEVENRLRGERTAVIVVHPWGIDDGQGWRTPEPAGAAFQCTPVKNAILLRHVREVVDPFLKALRGKVRLVAYSLPGIEDPVRKKIYRSIRARPSAGEREAGKRELGAALAAFSYRGGALPEAIPIGSCETACRDYFARFPGLDAGSHYDPEGFWSLPIPVTSGIDVDPEDLVIYDGEGYPSLRDFLKGEGIRHVILCGYNTDMCVISTTAGHQNLAKDFNVFLVGDATVATFPANSTPRHATNAAVSFAALNLFITQGSWIRTEARAPPEAKRPGRRPDLEGKALVAITLDLEMSRNFPRWEDTHWDYEKGNLDAPTKAYAAEAARRVRARGGTIQFFVVGRVLEQEDVKWLGDLAAAGHPLGNHTYDHVFLKARTVEEVQYRFARAPWLVEGRAVPEIIAENVERTTQAMKVRLGKAPSGFRSPGGFADGLKDRPDLQAMLLRSGFRWVSTLYPGHPMGNPGEEPGPEILRRIAAAQDAAQPFAYPTGLVEIPMSPPSDIVAFRTGRWKLEWFLEALRRGVERAIERREVFDFLGHPSCLHVVDPDFRAIDLLCDLVESSRGQALLVDLEKLGTVPYFSGGEDRPR
jgi:putative heme-binding domain-containing protein